MSISTTFRFVGSVYHTLYSNIHLNVETVFFCVLISTSKYIASVGFEDIVEGIIK